MRMGLGCTALARGNLSGHIDGIGVYTAELLKHASPPVPGPASAQAIVQTPVVFGRKFAKALPDSRALPVVYSAAAALAAGTGLPFLGAAQLESHIDLFHATDHYIPKLRRTPIVATVHDIIGILHPEWVNPSLRGMKNAVFRKAVGWAQEIITISDYSAMDLAHWLGDKAPRITTVPQGVNADFFRVVPPETKAHVLATYGLQPGFFIAVGTLQPRKNVERIVQAHALLPADMRRAHPLVVVGQNGWRTEELLPALTRLEADGFGRWLQYVPRDDLFALLQSAVALAFPSLYEGFGLPVLEAFAARLPVITSNTTSLPEVAGPSGEAALLVSPTSVEEIAHAMRQVVEQPSLRGDLVRQGLVRVQQFGWAQTAARTQAVYQRMSA